MVMCAMDKMTGNYWELWGRRSTILNKVDRGGFTEKAIFHQRLKGGEGVSFADFWGRTSHAGLPRQGKFKGLAWGDQRD